MGTKANFVEDASRLLLVDRIRANGQVLEHVADDLCALFVQKQGSGCTALLQQVAALFSSQDELNKPDTVVLDRTVEEMTVARALFGLLRYAALRELAVGNALADLCYVVLTTKQPVRPVEAARVTGWI